MPAASAIVFDPALRAYRKDGAGDSGWIVLPAVDAHGQLHVLVGSGRFDTTGSSRAAVEADTAVANPGPTVNAPDSAVLHPLPTAVRFVGAGEWAVQINVNRAD